MAHNPDSFVNPSDPVLVTVAPEIPIDQIDSEEVHTDIERMLNVAYGEQTDRAKPVLVGLAAPQIGLSKRIILVDVAADGHGKVGDLRVFINPQVVWRSDEEAEWYEGCFSTDRVCGVVSRPKQIRVRAHTPQGHFIEEEYSGYTARIFQHEIDHLDGMEFVTHVTDDEKLHWVEEYEFPAYRDQEGWRHWPNKCPRERWNKIKGLA